jgi:hypothetical protein
MNRYQLMRLAFATDLSLVILLLANVFWLRRDLRALRNRFNAFHGSGN